MHVETKMKTHHSEYTPCRSCFFNVRSTDRYCPDCGRRNPVGMQSVRFRAFFLQVLLTALLSTLVGGFLLRLVIGLPGLFIGIVLGLITGLIWVPAEQKPEKNENDIRDNTYIAASALMGVVVMMVTLGFSKGNDVPTILFVGLLQGLVLGSLAGLAAVVVDRSVGDSFRQLLPIFLWKPSVNTLRAQEQAAEERIAQSRQRQKQITGTLDQVEAQDEAERWQPLKNNLRRARLILQEQMECCQLELMQMVLIRWYNRLQPLQSEWGHLDYDACDHRLEELQQTQELGRKHLAHWQKLGFETSTGRQGLEHLAEQLRKGLDACRLLEQALVERKAILALQGTLPVSAVDTSTAELLDSQSGLFYASVQALEEFGQIYHQLETEYSQLVSEGKLTQT